MKHNLTKTLLTVALMAIVGLGAMFALLPDTAQAASDEPIMRIALFSDLHVEYNLQQNDKPMRMSTAKSVQYLRQLTDDEGVDVVLVGGDMSGGRGTWTQSYIPKTMDSVYEFMAQGTKDGKVLFVTGNHDPEPSAAAKTPKGGVYSGDYSSYMLKNVGKFVSSLYAEDVKGGEKSPYNELLCYRYTINGIEFVGVNTPWVSNQATVCGFYAEQTQWLKEEMAKIGKDKTTFLICHYPKDSLKTISNPSTYAASNTCSSDMKQVLAQYPNIIYCYGHVHSGDTWWAKTKTLDILKLEGRTSLAAQGIYKNTGIIYTHMGSMGYYENVYQPGSLSAADPQVCQFLTVDLYANRITFQSHNTGAKYHPNGTKEIQPITVHRNLAAQFGLPDEEGYITTKNTNTLTLTGDSSDQISDVTDSVDTPITNDGSVSDVPTTPVAPSTGGDVNVPSEDTPAAPSDDVADVEGTDATTSGTDDGDAVKDGSAGTVLIIVLCVVGAVVIGAGVAVAVLVKKKK